MIEQILPNNKEKCYRNFNQKFLTSKQALNRKEQFHVGTEALSKMVFLAVLSGPEKQCSFGPCGKLSRRTIRRRKTKTDRPDDQNPLRTVNPDLIAVRMNLGPV
jgi:hypothetical protein